MRDLITLGNFDARFSSEFLHELLPRAVLPKGWLPDRPYAGESLDDASREWELDPDWPQCDPTATECSRSGPPAISHRNREAEAKGPDLSA